MWPFKSVKNLDESGIMGGLTDWHSHILPGVDDGIRSIDDSLSVLRNYEEKGVKKVWLTPHVMEDYPNKPSELRKRFEELKGKYTGSIELRLAAENMLDSLFEERLKAKDLLTIGEDGNHLLVETSYMNPPYGMEDMLKEAMSAGYNLILAHPERYRYMNEEDYYSLKDKGILFQMNMMSLVGRYGEMARNKSEWLLKNGLIDLTGSDLHHLKFFESLKLSPKKKHSLDSLLEVAKNPAIE